ncbi:MAG: nitronate monooxygenase [Actinomycetes bacterium]
MSVLDRLACPIVQAPLAGGPSTPALAAAVAEAGGLGFVAAGYLSPAQLREHVSEVRRRTNRPFGINVFVPGTSPADPNVVRNYAGSLAPIAEAEGVPLGEPNFDDDHFAQKLAICLDTRPAAMSTTFGCLEAPAAAELKAAGIEVWITVTDPSEARRAAAIGADAVICQGAEAGGHRGSFVDNDDEPIRLIDLIGMTKEALIDADRRDVRVIAAGGLMTGAHIAEALRAGANAAQLGTAFMLCPETGTSTAHRAAIETQRATTVTRAFTGRRARGISNAWTDRIGDAAPSAYPEIHYLTAPLRAHGRATDNADLINLWAGERHGEARAIPAADLVAQLCAELSSARGAVG